jgi:hypothetical protein
MAVLIQMNNYLTTLPYKPGKALHNVDLTFQACSLTSVIYFNGNKMFHFSLLRLPWNIFNSTDRHLGRVR